jgi:hypothetical protein
MEDRLYRIEKRLDAIDQNLERHMQRSDYLEKQMEPVKSLMNEMIGAIKFVKFVGVLAAILECIHLWL